MLSRSRVPLRVLHVVGGLQAGGTETWLLHVLRRVDRTVLQMEFVVHGDASGYYEQEIRSLGSRVHRCLSPRVPWRYARNFIQLMRQHGPYHIVHSHVHYYSGFVMWLARVTGVANRIAHSHNSSEQDVGTPVHRRVYMKLARQLMHQNATSLCAVSMSAARGLFGSSVRSDPRLTIVPCGVDLAEHAMRYDTNEVRRSIGIPPEAFVLGHIGRFEEQKNHKRVVEVAARMMRIDPRLWLLLVGDGEQRPLIQRVVQEAGLLHRTVFLGVRSDVPRLLKAAIDVVLFPSLFEGLGLVAIEAQAAGVPVVASDRIPQEAVMAPTLVRIPLSASSAVWAETVRDVAERFPLCTRSSPDTSQWPNGITRSTEQLVRLYEAMVTCTPGGSPGQPHAVGAGNANA